MLRLLSLITALLLAVSCKSDPPPAPLGLLPTPGGTHNIPTCGLTTPGAAWTRHLIHDGIFGVDGTFENTSISPGTLYIAAPWEQSGDLTLSSAVISGGVPTFSTVTLDAAFLSAEGAAWHDFDSDGQDDICITSQTGDTAIYFAPALDSDLMTPGAWTKMPLTNSDMNSQEGWMACDGGDVDGDGHQDLILGGTTLISGGDLVWVKGPSSGKRTDANWPAPTIIEGSGRVMSLYAMDVDGDADIDIVASIRFAPGVGTFWQENSGTGTFTRREISTNVAGTQTLMMFTPGDWDDDGDLDICNGSDGGSTIRCHHNIGNTWLSFVPTLIRYPATVGLYQSSSIGDLNLDGYPDIVLSFNTATTGLSGLVWLKGPRWERGEIQGTDAFTSKFDNAVLFDVDDDGDLDVIAGDQGDEDTTQEGEEGLSWWENPCL